MQPAGTSIAQGSRVSLSLIMKNVNGKAELSTVAALPQVLRHATEK